MLHHLDNRPVGDPLAIGQAAAADESRVDLLQRLHHEPRLAYSRIPHDRDEFAARTSQRTIPRIDKLSQFALATDEAPGMHTLRHFMNRDQRIGGDGLALPFQFEQSLPADLDRCPHQPERLGADQ